MKNKKCMSYDAFDFDVGDVFRTFYICPHCFHIHNSTLRMNDAKKVLENSMNSREVDCHDCSEPFHVQIGVEGL